MLDRDILIDKMKEREFTVYATMGKTKIQFVSSHMYDTNYIMNTPKRKQMPIINIIVDVEKEEFECQYNISGSMNMLKSPNCGSVMNDEHFDRIVCGFESEAKWLSKLSD